MFLKCRPGGEALVVSLDDAQTPEYESSFSVYWALYNRDLSQITSTIHLWRSSTDTDIAVRSSTPCFALDDTAESCFARAAAVGTELMCEVVESLIKTRTVSLEGYQKYASAAKNAEPTQDVRREVESYLRRGLIKHEAEKRMRF